MSRVSIPLVFWRLFLLQSFQNGCDVHQVSTGWVAGNTFLWVWGYTQVEREFSHLPRSGAGIRLRGPVPPLSHMYCHLWPVWLYHIFPHYSINGTGLGKIFVLVFMQLFLKYFSF
jgi:hypothetical protein